MAKTLASLKGLGPVEVARLAGHKLRRHARHTLERSGGSERLIQRRDALAAEWLADHGTTGMAAWLCRPGAGVWWPADAMGTCTAADMVAAEEAVAGRLTVLGVATPESGLPAWHRDLYSGVTWPLEPSSSLSIMRGDGSDIRTVWELSRCYHFLTLGRAWAVTGDARFADTFAAHARSFSACNPPGLGPHWASAMDVAIRAANWSAAVQHFRDAPLSARFWADLLADLRIAGNWIEEHLEWHPVYRGNHYVANLVGLVYLGVLFRDTADGKRWLRRGGDGLRRELHYQVGYDGVAFEGALAYHRLHTELFAWAGELLRANDPAFDAAEWDLVLDRMTSFIGCYLQPDGRAPMMGDADDGRLHALDARALAQPRAHSRGLPARYPVRERSDGAYCFPAGGFHVLRHGRHHAVIRCGPVGLKGAGSHDHNDQLAFELVVDGRRLVSDSGTYAYTRDLAARHAFRATAAHSVVQLGGEEQNPIDMARPWRVLEDRTRSRLLACEAVGERLLFAGEHSGYKHRPSGAVCRRILELDPATGVWLLEDEVAGAGDEELVWRLHLDLENVVLTGGEGKYTAVCADRDGGRYTVAVILPDGVECRLERGMASDAYGAQRPRAVLVASGDVVLPARIECRIWKSTAETK